MTLHDRIAAALGWTPEQARSFSLLALRDLVHPVSPKLAHEATLTTQSGRCIIDDCDGPSTQPLTPKRSRLR